MKEKNHVIHIIIISQLFFFQNSEILSRKSSASSTGSLDRNNEKLKSCSAGRNTPQIANSVKAKIAMFSSSPPAPSSMSSSSSSCTESQSLTRSLTHTDVRYDDHHSDSNSGPGSKNNNNLVPKTIADHSSMVNVNNSSNV